MFNGVKLGAKKQCNQYFINQEMLAFAPHIDLRKIFNAGHTMSP